MINKKYSESLEDYLEAIYIYGGVHVKSIDLAKHLDVSRASVNKAINILKEKGLVDKALYGDISLTEKGLEISKDVMWKHNVLKRFFVEILDVEPKRANKEACGVEHSISSETTVKLEKLIDKLQTEE